MSNLIPTHRVDKNGKVVLRHVKPNSPAGSKDIPAPFTNNPSSSAVPVAPEAGNILSRWKDRRERKKATKALIEALDLDNGNVYHGLSANNLPAILDRTLSTEDIGLAVDVTLLVTRSSVPSGAASADRGNVVWSLTKGVTAERSGIAVRALYAHKDWLEEHPGEAGKLRKTIDNLSEIDMVSNGGRDGIGHLDAYMDAAHHPAFESFDIIHKWRKDFFNAVVRRPDQVDNIATYIMARNGFKEEGFDDFLSAASKHPDKMDRMLDYLRERDDFDEAGFEQYLNTATPLAGGAL